MGRAFSAENSDQAPRERLFAKGRQALADRELVAILLRTGRPGEPVLALADRLLRDGLKRLARMDAFDLERLGGIGPAKAASLVAAFEIGRRAGEVRGQGMRLDHPEALYAVCRLRFPQEREELRAFYLDSGLRLVSEEVVSRGGGAWTGAEPSDVFGPALRRRARAVALAHNHPAGDPTPSPEDIAATRRLAEAGAILGVELVDHVVIGEGRFFSFRRQSSVWGGGKEPGRR